MEEIRLNGMPVEACLLDYVEGRLPAEAARAVEAFLAENADWAAQVALLREPVPVSADAVSEALACPPELKARLLRPMDARGRSGGGVRFGRPARSVRPVGVVRRGVYYAAAAVAVLLVASGIVWRTAGDRSDGRRAVLSAMADMDDAVAALSVEPDWGQAAVPERPSDAAPEVTDAGNAALETAQAVEVVSDKLLAMEAPAPVAPVGVEKSSHSFFEIQPLRGVHRSADWLETRGQVQTLLARDPVEVTAADFSGRAGARRPRFEPDALIAQAYAALARRIERQRIRKEIQREVTASLQADAETQPVFWDI
ncbi:MAG: hypothetical protein K2O01_03990 [Bacteroidales bacterium]|nr:hypothetical protein [Bacteroidales bacterium]